MALALQCQPQRNLPNGREHKLHNVPRPAAAAATFRLLLPLTLTMTMRSVNKFYAVAICIGINIFVAFAFVPFVAFAAAVRAALVPRHYVNLWHLQYLNAAFNCALCD